MWLHRKKCNSLVVYRLVHALVIYFDRAKAGFDSPPERQFACFYFFSEHFR